MKKKSSLLILILTIGVFGILNTEMGVVGILPLIAQKFNVSVPTAGWLVSGFALVVAFAGAEAYDYSIVFLHYSVHS